MSVNATSAPRSRRRRGPLASALLVLAVAALTSAAARAEVLLMPATGAGISSKLIQTTRALLLQRLVARHPRTMFLDMDRPPVATPVAVPFAVAAAQERDARAVILFDLRREGESTTLSVSGHLVPEGERLFAFAENTAGGPEALPDMVERAVQSTLLARPIPPEPRQYYVGARAGLVIPAHTAGHVEPVFAGAGAYMVKDMQFSFLELGLDFAGNSPDYRVGFGPAVHFVATDHIYLGTSLRWVWSKMGGQGASGLCVTPAVGWLWRTKATTLRAEGGYFVDLFTEAALDRLVPGSGQRYRGYGGQLGAGLWF
jgi:hypothetical protein